MESILATADRSQVSLLGLLHLVCDVLCSRILMKGNLMDPNACHDEMTDAIEEVDRLLVLARKRAVALYEWIGGGGFYPNADPSELVRMTINQVFLRTDDPEEA